ncbi:MAG: ATP-binding protein [Acidobacteriota bacterium]|nr:ATP-binding protein [Acidobacteriota bacterium]
MGKQRFTYPYMWSVVALGAMVLLFSILRLPLARLDPPFLILVLMTVALSCSLAVRIPRVTGTITVSDTFIFLTMLLYGGEAAVLLAATDGLCSSLRISRKPRTILFNSSVMACSTFLTVRVLRLSFGPIIDLPHFGYTANYITAICLMALVQYIANSGLIAVEKSCKLDQHFTHIWTKYYLWTSITYFAGASAAGIIARLIDNFGFYAVITTAPIIAVIYLTYRTYLKNIESSASQAEQAERHIEELNHYIAERKRAEDERDKLLISEREARREAEAANRIKDEFLATLSHELRTPLTSILGWSGLLLRGSGLDRTMQTQALEIIERNAHAQKQLIDDLLDVSRIISGKLRLNIKALSLDKVIRDAIEVVRPAAEAKKIQIKYGRAGEADLMHGDPARLQQVVWNLLYNAVKFTPEGGRVEVRLEIGDSHAKISVADTGKGITPEFLPFVFDLFRQADGATTRTHSGLGIGLAIVRHLVESHGGTVRAESPGQGKGATFSITLPIPRERPESGEARTRSQLLSFGKSLNAFSRLEGLRVLIVDDEPDARNMISAVLAQSGAEVKACGSTGEALRTLDQWRPDVLVSDIGMPNEDGYTLISRVRALGEESISRIPAAALTAYAREEDRERALAAGYQMHVCKPVGSDELLAAVADLAKRVA